MEFGSMIIYLLAFVLLVINLVLVVGFLCLAWEVYRQK